ncbi:MAG: DUF4157 domain-containing protein [Vulcanimicrobiaceae bacterium]
MSGCVGKQRAPAGASGTCTECESCRSKAHDEHAERPFGPQTVQRAARGATRTACVPASVREAIGSTGQPLDAAARGFFEPRFGADLSRVRVHADARAARSAEDVNAFSYTVGTHVVFGPQQYAPHTSAGRSLLAHELAHVLQQRSGAAPPAGVSRPADSAELQADRLAEDVVRSGEGPVYEKPRTARSALGSTANAAPTTSKLRVQRKIRLGGTNLDARGADRLAQDLIRGDLRDVVPKVVPAQLVLETVREMQRVSDVLEFAEAKDVASDVRERVLVSHYIRASQGSTLRHKGFSYPNRAGDGTAGVGPKVNDDAKALWGAAQDPDGDYFFDLSAAGAKNPYQSLVKLFTEQNDPHKRTLIHCDYLLSVIRFRSFAETIGVERFNALVAVGALSAPGEPPMRLKWDGFDDLTKLPSITLPIVGTIPLAKAAPLHQVTVASKKDFVIGDHVVFYNHPTYDALIEGVGGVWRLENAIVVDRSGGQFRYQGHGYFTPVPEDVLLDGMIRQYNKHVDEALGIVRRMDNPKTKAAAGAEKVTKYPNIWPKASSHGWEISGKGLCDTTATRDLKHLTRAEAPGLVDPCSGDIVVRRPAEQKP